MTPRDRLVLKDGIRQDEIYFIRIGNNLEIVIMDGVELISEATNRIHFVSFFSSANRRILDITFDDGTILTLAEILTLVDILPVYALPPYTLPEESEESEEPKEPYEPVEILE